MVLNCFLLFLFLLSPTMLIASPELNKLIAIQQAQLKKLQDKVRFTETLQADDLFIKYSPPMDVSQATKVFEYTITKGGNYEINFNLSSRWQQLDAEVLSFRVMIVKNNEPILFINQTHTELFDNVAGHALVTDAKKGDILSIRVVNYFKEPKAASLVIIGKKHSFWSIVQL